MHNCYSSLDFRTTHNIKISRTTAASILRNHGWIYARNAFKTKKTAYKHQSQRLNELRDYLLICLFYDSLQRHNKVVQFHHDESWIEVKPIYEKIWRHKAANCAHSLGRSRLAFSCLWGIDSGVLGLENINFILEKRIKCCLATWKDVEPKSAKIFIKHCQEFCIPDILHIHHPNAKNKKNGVKTDEYNSSFFCFRVYTQAQNKGTSQQMNGISFIESVKKMVKIALLKYRSSRRNQKALVIHFDNATYHRELVDCEWSSAKSEYRSRNAEPSSSRLYWLQQWKIKPENASDEFFKEIQVQGIKKLPNETREDWIQRKNNAKFTRAAHHKKINELFLNSEQVRSAKTKIECELEKISAESGITIIPLFGTRGYSEIMPIEYLWGWAKDFVKKLSPQNSNETTQCLKFAMTLSYIHKDFFWRKGTQVRECYRKLGHFEFIEWKKMLQNWSSHKRQYDELLSDIFKNFGHQLFPTIEYFEKYREKVSHLLLFTELLSLRKKLYKN